ncbi:MAG: DUF2975 domain-containing protein [Eubacteriales bacterium]|nr:DUF2975 domain-containing protein [Eubacteriales bacterium]
MEQERINKITKIIVDIMFYSGLVVFVTLPWTLKLAGIYYSKNFSEHYLSMLFIFAAAGIFGIIIIAQLRRMMKTVISGACFVYDNVRSLEIMAALSLSITVLFIIKMFVVPTPATVIIILVFFIAALFSQVLANVFAEAIRFKEENDLTI